MAARIAAWCVLAVAFLVGLCGSDTVTTPPSFVLNLDLAPEDRWTNIVTKYKDMVPYIKRIMEEIFDEDIIPLVETIAAEIDAYLPYPYTGEMRGIAAAANASLGDVVFLNLIYDLSAFCTSIVSQDSHGQIWHSRNLDYTFTTILRNLTIEVDFQRQGHTEYSALTFAGYVGILTGQKPNAFTVTVDERDDGDIWMNILIGILDRAATPMSFLIRDTLELSTTFEGAVQQLSDTDTEASAYIIVGGVNKNEGAVITKGRLEPVNVWYLNVTGGRWYLVETNYDHWLPPPPSDDRRHPAMKAMNSTGPDNLSVNSLFNVMSTEKVLNNHTVYSVVMSALQPQLMKAWVRHYPN